MVMKRVAIITGSSSGLGREAALVVRKYFSFDDLILIARREDLLLEVASNIKKDYKDLSVHPLPLDLTLKNLLSLPARLDDIVPGEKKIVFLMNNAGFGTYGEFWSTPLDRMAAMVELNCAVVMALTHTCLPLMERGSVILNTSSLAAFAPLGNFSVYAATKSFVLSFSLSLRAELKPRGISVTALCPGSVSSEFAKVASNGAREKVLGGVDPKKVAQHGLKAAKLHKATAIMCLKWKVSALISHFVSPNLVAWATYKFHKRPFNHTSIKK